MIRKNVKAKMFTLATVFLSIVYITHGLDAVSRANSSGLLVITVALEKNDAFARFERSLNKYGYNYKVLGMEEELKLGDKQNVTDGIKINLLKDNIWQYKDRDDLLLMVVDSTSLVFTDEPEHILHKYGKFDHRVVFSADKTCWPNLKLLDSYPPVKPKEKRFLNSGGFIGPASDIYGIITSSPVDNKVDEQLFYTEAFLDSSIRERFSIGLDKKGEIFQNINGALHEVSVKFKGANGYLYNRNSGNIPIVVHGNDPMKVKFNSLANYLVDQWTQTEGCLTCTEGTISLNGLQFEDYPRVFLAIFIEYPTAFIKEFFKSIGELNWPKNKIDLFLHYADEFHRKDVEEFMDVHGTNYNDVQVYSPPRNLNDWTARNLAVDECIRQNCQYYFSVDGDVQLENKNVLQYLIERNRSIIAPLIIRPETIWSNFWGAMNNKGFYKRSADYEDIVEKKKKGLWNVPYVNSVYLVQGFRMHDLKGAFINKKLDADMAFCKTMRDKNIFMYVDNIEHHGYAVDSEDFSTQHLHNDLYEIFNNAYAWEKKYIRPEYHEVLNNKTMDQMFKELQPCPDVFWIPIVTNTFCKHMIEEMENLNQWSSGGNEDPRIEGGYENVPTVDTHTNQIDWEEEWLEMLDSYIRPMAEKVYEGYSSESEARVNFVVRYKPDEQDRLKPHADASTYTINIALNNVDEDYEGGGVRFLRYNCSVTKTKKGWLLMHPGRLTHHHEGLQTTNGTRYIFVSFVDPTT